MIRVIDKKEKIIIEWNGIISRIGRLNKEMENVISHTHNLVCRLSSKLIYIYISDLYINQIKEISSSWKCDNYEANEDEMTSIHDKELVNGLINALSENKQYLKD